MLEVVIRFCFFRFLFQPLNAIHRSDHLERQSIPQRLRKLVRSPKAQVEAPLAPHAHSIPHHAHSTAPHPTPSLPHQRADMVVFASEAQVVGFVLDAISYKHKPPYQNASDLEDILSENGRVRVTCTSTYSYFYRTQCHLISYDDCQRRRGCVEQNVHANCPSHARKERNTLFCSQGGPRTPKEFLPAQQALPSPFRAVL